MSGLHGNTFYRRNYILLQPSRSGWQTIFYVSSALSISGMLLFLLLGSGEEQAWAKQKGEEVEVDGQEDTDL